MHHTNGRPSFQAPGRPSFQAPAVVHVNGVSGARTTVARRLRDSCPLHIGWDATPVSKATGIPTFLQSGVYYVPSWTEDGPCDSVEHVGLNAISSLQVWLLWPALQDPPAWLRQQFTLVQTGQVKVSWCFGFKHRTMLNITNRRQAFQEQTLQVWQLRSGLGRGGNLVLPGLALPASSLLPLYSYVLCFRPNSLSSTIRRSAEEGTGFGQLLDASSDPSAVGLQQLRSALEDGSLAVTELSSTQAAKLVQRCLVEEESELLLMLLEVGIDSVLPEAVLQDVLVYGSHHHQIKLVQLALSAGSAEMTLQVLNWWVHTLMSGTNLFDVERLLADYCLARRNPLSAVAAIEMALHKAYSEAGLQTAGPLAAKFCGVKHTLLQQLFERDIQQQAAEALSGQMAGETAAEPSTQSGLQQIVARCMEVKPAHATSSIHDSSPYVSGLYLNDFEMLSKPSMQTFTKGYWVGHEMQQLYAPLAQKGNMLGSGRSSVRAPVTSGPRKQAASAARMLKKLLSRGNQPALEDDEAAPPSPKATSIVVSAERPQPVQLIEGFGTGLHNPNLGWELLQNMGLASRAPGTGPGPMASHLAHMVLLAPRAFYNSPRGQWWLHCCIELLFLINYQMLMMGVRDWGLELLLALQVGGNVARMITAIVFRYRGNLRKYLTSHWSKLDMIVHFSLAAVVVDRLLEDEWQNGWAMKVAAAIAMLVWARALGVIVPVNARLGALLYTLGRMVEASYTMGLIITVMIVGFGTSLYANYHPLIPNYSSFSASLRMMFGALAGDLHLQEFEEYNNGDSYFQWFGQLMTILFIIVDNILLMSLLIAVINHTYHPEAVSKQTMVMFADAAHNYAWQAEHGEAVAPYNMMQLALMWVPPVYRRRVPHQACLARGLPPVDGFSSSVMAPRSTALLPTGPREMSFVVFVVIVYPVMGMLAVLLLLLRIPFGVLHFVTEGYKVWFSGDWEGAAGSGGKQVDSSRRLRALRSQVENERASEAGGSRTSLAGWDMRAGGFPTFHRPDNTQPETGLVPFPTSRFVMAVSFITAPFRAVLFKLFCIVAALGLQVAVVLVLVVAMVYSLAAQLVWSSFCSFFWWLLPASMLEKQRPFTKRTADFWTKEDISAAFKQHQILHSRTGVMDLRMLSGTRSSVNIGRLLEDAGGAASVSWPQAPPGLKHSDFTIAAGTAADAPKLGGRAKEVIMTSALTSMAASNSPNRPIHVLAVADSEDSSSCGTHTLHPTDGAVRWFKSAEGSVASSAPSAAAGTMLHLAVADRAGVTLDRAYNTTALADSVSSVDDVAGAGPLNMAAETATGSMPGARPYVPHLDPTLSQNLHEPVPASDQSAGPSMPLRSCSEAPMSSEAPRSSSPVLQEEEQLLAHQQQLQQQENHTNPRDGAPARGLASLNVL